MVEARITAFAGCSSTRQCCWLVVDRTYVFRYSLP